MTDIKSKTVRGAFWVLMEKMSLQLVSFCVTLVLARLLTPSDYGTVALLTIFLAVLGVLVDAGFGSALVQKKDATDLHFNSVFYLSIAVSVCAYALLFLCAPSIAGFYAVPELKPIVRVVGLQLVFNAINSVQTAELTRKMLFHLSFRISLISTLPSAAVGIAMAYLGYGPWALVCQSMTSSALGVVARWFIIAWRPRLMFSFAALRGLFSFGWKMSVNSMIEVAFDNTWGLIVGKVYQKSELAFINKGKHLPALLMDSINGTLTRVSFPALVQFQNDRHKIREATRRIIQCSSFLVFPAMMGMAASASEIVYLLFGTQWTNAIPYARLGCFQLALWPLSLVQMTLMAIGRSDVLVKINVVRKVIGFAIMGATLWISPLVFMAAMAFVYTPVGTWTNTIPNKKLFGYTLLDELRDVASIIVATVAMTILVWGAHFALVHCGLGGTDAPMLALRLFVQVVVGVSAYTLISIRLHVPAMAELARMAYPRVERRFPRFAMACMAVERKIGGR
jgi:O-antigen/teichoic acid export membrane protein